ncbi:YppE family protein [Bacillus taeanensis]|uniref:YppE family protein n=1 Tax=Bacillus taeanensis TaxID=273032 RepID=UPI001FE62E8E|nr:YppE family protein [Bacillus taeanensis]
MNTELTKTQQLLLYTKQLQQLNKQAYDQYHNRTKHEGYEVNFYEEVKPFADEVLAISNNWKPLAEEWIADAKPKYVYPIQIHDTYENLTIISVTAFQKDTKEKRFNEMIKSIDYVLHAMIEQLKYA